jgi:acetoin utilization protein AcuB
MSRAGSAPAAGGWDLAAWPEPVPVSEWMTTPVITVRADAPAREAAGAMKRRNVRHLPVLGEDGRLMGILTDRDLRQIIFDPAIQERLGIDPQLLETLQVREVMTWSVITIHPDQDIRQAARAMHEEQIGALPVVVDGRVVGASPRTTFSTPSRS